MKKGMIAMLAASAFSALILASCGEKFTPLTPEQITARVDSTFEAQKEARLTELRAACQSGLEAQVNAKVEMMKTGETAAQ